MIDPSLALQIVRSSKVIAFDTETTGLGMEAMVCGYVITDFDHSLYIPVRHEPGGNIVDVDDFELELADAFKERSRLGLRTVGHSLGFDLRMSARHGVVLGAPLEDTELNEGLIDDIALRFNLSACCERHGVTAKLGDALYAELARRFGGLPVRNQMQHFWRMPGDDPVVVEYATGDGVSTLELWASQQDRLDQLDLRRVWQLECDLIPYVHKMHAKGLRVDQVYAEQVKEQIARRIEEAQSLFPKGFNVRSPGDVEQAFRANGITDFKLTEGGRASFTEGWLEKHELGNAILDVRRLLKARDSFIEPLITTFNVNGRIHPVLHQGKNDENGAVGGRFSCSDPNMQAFPKRNHTVGKVVRPLIIPDDGKIIAEADFSQQEPHLFAHYSEDEALVRGYNSIPPVDIHTSAMNITGMTNRDMAKRLGMGILTGMGSATMQANMSKYNWTLNDAKRGINTYLDAFPGIRQFQRDAKATMEARGFVRTLLGRRAQIDDMRFSYKAVSRVIQGSGGDHMKLALLRAHQYAEQFEHGGESIIDILLTIHDSNLFQFEEGREDKMKEMVRVIEDTAQVLNLIVPIPCDVGVGRNWSEASYSQKAALED